MLSPEKTTRLLGMEPYGSTSIAVLNPNSHLEFLSRGSDGQPRRARQLVEPKANSNGDGGRKRSLWAHNTHLAVSL